MTSRQTPLGLKKWYVQAKMNNMIMIGQYHVVPIGHLADKNQERHQFYDAGALDEIALSIAPVALTSGAPLFPRRVESDRLRLVEARQVGQFARLRFVVDAPRVGPAGD